DCENRAAMGKQAIEDMVAVLPHAFGNNERRLGVKPAENFHSHLLGINEAVLLFHVVRMGSNNGPAFGFQGLGENSLHFGLLGPALLVCGKAEVPVGHEISLAGFKTMV